MMSIREELEKLLKSSDDEIKLAIKEVKYLMQNEVGDYFVAKSCIEQLDYELLRREKCKI